jgi:hypothetical protein
MMAVVGAVTVMGILEGNVGRRVGVASGLLAP